MSKDRLESNHEHSGISVIHDSTIISDSVYIYIKGDTVYRDRWHTVYKEKSVEKNDSTKSKDAVESVSTKASATVQESRRFKTKYILLVSAIIVNIDKRNSSILSVKDTQVEKKYKPLNSLCYGKSKTSRLH